jgi:hypothetical protein
VTTTRTPTTRTPGEPSGHVSLHIWRVPGRAAPRALWRIARDRRGLRRTPGVRFAKLLGTGAGRRFGATLADPTRWVAVIAWEDQAAAGRFDTSPVARAWRAMTDGYCRIDLRPVAARGSWAGRQPFGGGPPATGVVLALTRARLRPTRAVRFWRAIAPVAAATATAPGLLATFGIGEAPIGWQGTVSLWRSTRDLVEFAYRHPHHRDVIDRTPALRWYAEELFARFAVLAVAGDRDVIGWTGDETDESGRTGSP